MKMLGRFLALALVALSTPVLAGGSAAPLPIISLPVLGGTNNTLLSKDNSGNLASTNTLTSVTPSFGATAASSLALGGATIGTHKLAVTGTASISGVVTLGAGSAAATTINFGTANAGIYASGADVVFSNSGFGFAAIRGGLFIAANDSGFGFASASGDALGGSTDVILRRDAANTLALRNGTAAQAFNVYNTYTDATNYERGNIGWIGNALYVQTQKSGSGLNRDIYLKASSGAEIHLTAQILMTGDIVNGAANLFAWAGRSEFTSPVDGQILVRNTANTGFDRLMFGKIDNTAPALRVSSTRLQHVLADASGYAGVDASDIGLIGASGSKLEVLTLTELTTIAAAATTDTAIQIPANAILLAVQVRTTTVIPTAATYTVTGTGSSTVFNTAAVSAAATSTDPGTAAGAFYNATAQTIRITPNATPADNTGRVRVTIRYFLSTPPTQ